MFPKDMTLARVFDRRADMIDELMSQASSQPNGVDSIGLPIVSASAPVRDHSGECSAIFIIEFLQNNSDLFLISSSSIV